MSPEYPGRFIDIRKDIQLDAIINSLLQASVLSLLVERITDAIHKLLLVPARKAESSPDWGWLGTTVSTALGLIICYAYGFDLVKIVTSGSENQHVGFILSALVLGGGSAGIRSIIDVLRANLKASKAEAQARLRLSQAQSLNIEASKSERGRAAEEGALAHYELPNLLTPIDERVTRAVQLCDVQGVYRRGCSEFVCAVLGIAWEQANDLMGDNPVEITDWSLVKPGAIVGWKTNGGSGHVSVYVNDGTSKYIDVREPASTSNPNPKPRRLISYGNSQKMYLSSRFGT